MCRKNLWIIVVACFVCMSDCIARIDRQKKSKKIEQCGSAQIGTMAPDFKLLNEEGVMVKLSDYKGKKVALYFYPMDNTWGCTKQACSLRDGFTELKKAGISIIGISADSVASHQKFKRQRHLPYMLLSDTDQKVAHLYGTKRSWFLSWMGPQRVTFLIDEQGSIIDILKNIQLKKHADQVIKAFDKSKK